MTTTTIAAACPRFKQGSSVHFAGANMFVRRGTSVVSFEGKAVELFRVLVPLLDGRHSIADIARSLEPELQDRAADVVQRAIEILRAKNVLDVDATETETRLVTLMRSLYPAATSEMLEQRIAASPVSVIGASDAARALADALSQDGLNVLPASESGNDAARLHVVVADQSDAKALRELNQRFLMERKEWMQVVLFDGVAAVVGPIFVPGESPCAECFASRRAANAVQSALFSNPATFATAYPSTSGIDAMVIGMAATSVEMRIAVGDSSLVNRFHALEVTPQLAWSSHELHRVPRCAVCSKPSALLPWYEIYG